MVCFWTPALGLCKRGMILKLWSMPASVMRDCCLHTTYVYGFQIGVLLIKNGHSFLDIKMFTTSETDLGSAPSGHQESWNLAHICVSKMPNSSGEYSMCAVYDGEDRWRPRYGAGCIVCSQRFSRPCGIQTVWEGDDGFGKPGMQPTPAEKYVIGVFILQDILGLPPPSGQWNLEMIQIGQQLHRDKQHDLRPLLFCCLVVCCLSNEGRVGQRFGLFSGVAIFGSFRSWESHGDGVGTGQL